LTYQDYTVIFKLSRVPESRTFAHMKNLPLLGFILFFSLTGFTQPVIRKALFLGNSYIYVNDLPGLIASLAHAAGDSLVHDDNCPGGYTLGWNPIAHATDPISLSKIASGDWDFVVLQEQSQIPSIPVLRDSCMIPSCFVLRDSVISGDECGRLLFFLTWGRRFGGIQCFTPAYCSVPFANYFQMQDSLTRAYKLTADTTDSGIAPVGEAWRKVIQNSGIVLHDGDGSHPNLNGSYLAACVFYAVLFHKSPVGLSFTAGLQPDTALYLQKSADSVVFGNPGVWNLWGNEPQTSFNYFVAEDSLFTENLSLNTHTWHWDFGDGFTAEEYEPVHCYADAGVYSVTLRACDRCICDSITQEVTVVVTGGGNHHTEKSSLTFLRADQGIMNVLNRAGDGVLTLFDPAGRMVKQVRIQFDMKVIVALAPGFYGWTFDRVDQKSEKGKIIFW